MSQTKTKCRVVWNGEGFNRSRYQAQWFDSVKWSDIGSEMTSNFQARTNCLMFTLPSGGINFDDIITVLKGSKEAKELA